MKVENIIKSDEELKKELEKGEKLDIITTVGFLIGVEAHRYIPYTKMTDLIIDAIERATADDEDADVIAIYKEYAKDYFLGEEVEL